VRSSDYCSAHSGLGISQDPAGFAAKGGKALAERSERRAALRLALGLDRAYGPRAALKAAASLEASRIAGRVIGTVIDPKVDPVRAADLGLRLIDAVDPLVSVSVETEMPADLDALQGMSLGQLQAIAKGNGLLDADGL